jgi:hypothetical protein
MIGGVCAGKGGGRKCAQSSAHGAPTPAAALISASLISASLISASLISAALISAALLALTPAAALSAALISAALISALLAFASATVRISSGLRVRRHYVVSGVPGKGGRTSAGSGTTTNPANHASILVRKVRI